MPPSPRNPSGPTAGEMYDELMIMVTGLVAGAAIMPGFFLCVPGLILVVVPLVVIGLLVAIVGLVLALATVPLLLGWRLARRRLRTTSDSTGDPRARRADAPSSLEGVIGTIAVRS